MVRIQSSDGQSKLWAILPPWMRKLLHGNYRFWAYTPEEIERHLEGRKMTAAADNAAAELRQRERDEMRRTLGMAVVSPANSEVDSLGYADAEAGNSNGAGLYELEDPKQHRPPQSGLLSSKSFEPSPR